MINDGYMSRWWRMPSPGSCRLHLQLEHIWPFCTWDERLSRTKHMENNVTRRDYVVMLVHGESPKIVQFQVGKTSIPWEVATKFRRATPTRKLPRWFMVYACVCCSLKSLHPVSVESAAYHSSESLSLRKEILDISKPHQSTNHHWQW